MKKKPISLSLLLSYFILHISYCSAVGFAQQPSNTPGAGMALDSLRILQRSTDSLLRADSVQVAIMRQEERAAESRRQLATQREIDMTNDGKPEVLRLSGYLAKNVDDTKLQFTIKSGKKLLFQDSWTTGGYFDTADHLPDSVKLRRIRQIVTVAFANENFTVVDSADFADLFTRVSPAELDPNSAEAHDLFHEPRVMYSVFHSRDYWYGLVWDPKRQKFVRVWKN